MFTKVNFSSLYLLSTFVITNLPSLSVAYSVISKLFVKFNVHVPVLLFVPSLHIPSFIL